MEIQRNRYADVSWVQYIVDIICGRRIFFEPDNCSSFKELSDTRFFFGCACSCYNSQLERFHRTPQCYFDNLTLERKEYFRSARVLSDKYKKERTMQLVAIDWKFYLFFVKIPQCYYISNTCMDLNEISIETRFKFVKICPLEPFGLE